MVWLIGALVERDAVDGDVLMMAALRQIKGGDIGPDNIALTQGLLDVLLRNRVWLEKHPLLIATVWYTFTRLATDHNVPALQELRPNTVVNYQRSQSVCSFVPSSAACCCVLSRSN